MQVKPSRYISDMNDKLYLLSNLSFQGELLTIPACGIINSKAAAQPSYRNSITHEVTRTTSLNSAKLYEHEPQGLSAAILQLYHM